MAVKDQLRLIYAECTVEKSEITNDRADPSFTSMEEMEQEEAAMDEVY